MKKWKGILCIIFLYMMVGTLTVHAEDHEMNSGEGIRFTDETEAETKATEKPSADISKKEDTAKTGSSKPSLPQTGQESGQILQAAGIVMLLFTFWWAAVKNRGKGTIFPERKRAGLSEDYGTE